MNIQVLKSLHGYHYKNLNIIEMGRIRTMEYVPADPKHVITAVLTIHELITLDERLGSFYLVELDNGVLLRVNVSYLLRKSKHSQIVGKPFYMVTTHSGEIFYSMNLDHFSLFNLAKNFLIVGDDPAVRYKYYADLHDRFIKRRLKRIAKEQSHVHDRVS